MIKDVLAEDAAPHRREEHPHASTTCGGQGRRLSASRRSSRASEAALKRFLTENVYRNEIVMRPVTLAEALIADLFEAFFERSVRRCRTNGAKTSIRGDAFRTARRVADYIAGMTDRYAVSEHQRLFDDTPDLG